MYNGRPIVYKSPVMQKQVFVDFCHCETKRRLAWSSQAKSAKPSFGATQTIPKETDQPEGTTLLTIPVPNLVTLC